MGKKPDDILNPAAFSEEQVNKFDEWTLPKLPYKRYLTNCEYDIIARFFGVRFSCSSGIDQNGYIILGNGIGEGGMYYLKESYFDLLDQYMKDPELYIASRKYNL